ncbi:hypothetical protein MHYP_G00349820 [Metynnis hypsauchen]
MTVSGAWLEYEYHLMEMRFHWGSKTTNGLEHTVKKRRFPMEYLPFTISLCYSDKRKLLIEDYRLIQSNFMCPVFTSPNVTVPKSRGDPAFIRSAIFLVISLGARLISASLYNLS